MNYTSPTNLHSFVYKKKKKKILFHIHTTTYKKNNENQNTPHHITPSQSNIPEVKRNSHHSQLEGAVWRAHASAILDLAHVAMADKKRVNPVSFG